MATTGVVQLIAIDEARHFNNNRIIKTHKKFRRIFINDKKHLPIYKIPYFIETIKPGSYFNCISASQSVGNDKN